MFATNASRVLRLALIGGLLAACAHSSPSGNGKLPPGAEPSSAPSVSVRPAGRIIQLPIGSEPEGVVVDDVTHTAVVALHNPNRLAIIDTRSDHVRLVTAPGHARHLVLAKPGGPILLPGEESAALFQLALPSGRLLETTAVLRHPHNAAVVGSNIWVADELQPAVSVIDPAGTVIATLHGPVQPGGVVSAAGIAAVTDVRGARLYFYDATTFASEGSIAAGSGPTHEARLGGGYVLVADTRGGALLLVDFATRRIVGRLPLPGGPYGVSSDPTSGTAWVTLTEFNRVVEVQRSGSHLRAARSWPTVQQPNTVAIDPASQCMYVVGVTEAQLQIICPQGAHSPR
jgi:DNA-binding beta-propeller fold protein YncE